MPFNYDTLKRITSASIVDGTLVTLDIATNGVTTAKLGNSAVSANKLASNAVDLGSSVVTGTAPITKGGTGLTSVGSNLQVLRSTGSALQYADIGLTSVQVFTGSTTWNRPAGVRFIHVQVVGGGGGGSGHGEGGGSGGYSERILNVESISSVSVTIGGEVGGSFYSGAGGNGNASSFGPYLSASGGYGANRNNQHSGGLAGVGSGGDLNIYGGGGGSHHHSFGPGGASYWGGSVAGGHPQGGNFSHNHQSHSAPGSGGRGVYFQGHLGSNGRPGMIVVTEYK
jgi:hypothetical protein